ncbi:MAG TPA: hypothetical protein VK674_04545 [Candidatus Limnocylindria bacterium]|nr:hypothetical protein [Candidatus Limnocylindria bacterium]
MKRLLILAALCSTFLVLAASPVRAQRPSVEYNEPASSTGQQSSGYYDKETGKPLSIDEYNTYREEAAEGVYEKYPVPATLVTVAVIGGIGYGVVRWRKKKAAKRQA